MPYTLRSFDDQLFKNIMIYATENNINALKAVNLRRFPVDPLSGMLIPLCGMITPAGCLAYHGNHEAVKLLIDNFGADVGYVIDGYAAAGDYDRAIQLLPSDKKSSDLIGRILMAAALRNELELVSERLNFHATMLSSVVMGYAMGGHVVSVDRYIEEKTPIVDIRGQGNLILVGGFVDLRCFIASAAFGYSTLKHFALLDQLLIKAKQLDAEDPIKSFNRYNVCLSKSTLAYAIVGEFEKANELVNKGADIMTLIMGAAAHGDNELVEQLIVKTGGDALEAAIQGFQMRDSFASPSTTIQLLAFINNPQIRKDFATRLQNDNKDLNVSPWLEKAIQLNKLMREHEIPYDQAVNRLNAQSRAAYTFMPPPRGAEVIEEYEEYYLCLPAKKS